MSPYGHCRHCDGPPSCELVMPDGMAPLTATDEWQHRSEFAIWYDCPACAEAKRIVAKIHAALDETPLLLDDTLDYRQGLLDAVEMARGES